MQYLSHYGIKGQRCGFRRYQNEDGTLTPEGREHYYGEPVSRKNQTVFVSGSSKNMSGVASAAKALRKTGNYTNEEIAKMLSLSVGELDKLLYA